MYKKIVVGILLLLITFLVVLVVVNLSNATEPIPETEVVHGAEVPAGSMNWC